MWGSSKIPVKKNKIPAPPGSQASPKILKRKKNHYTTNPPACPPPPRGQQPKTPWHKAFAQGISISTQKRSALEPKKPWLSKSPLPKQRKKCRFQIRKHSIGGPGVLWHLKSHTLPKAPSQSLRIPLWHLKSHTLPKATSQSPRLPVPKAETGVQSQNSASPNSGAFAHGCS